MTEPTTAPLETPREVVGHPELRPVVIERDKRLFRLNVQELLQNHELLFFLTWRDVKVRYKQAALGFAWAVLQPLMTMVVFTIFFGRIAGLSSGDLPYPLFVLAGIVLWTFFANALTNASQSLVASAGMLTKVYFPRLAIPTAATLGGVVDFVIAFAMLLVIAAGYGVSPNLAVLTVPLSVLIVLVASLGLGLLLSALNVRFRDIRFILPVLVQLWMLASPIAYSTSSIKEPWVTIYGLNPIAGAVELFRWGLIGAPAPPVSMVVVSCVSALCFLLLGGFVFGRMERQFADIV